MRKKWVSEIKHVVAARPSVHGGVVKSAGRVLAILEYFDEIQRPANVVEIAQTLRLPQSSTSALLRSLATIGYLHFDRTARTYRPSCRVALLGNSVNGALFTDGSMQRCMEELQQETGNTILLAVRNGVFSQYIHVVQGAGPKRLHVPRGTLRPIGASGTGYAILGSMPDAEVRKIAHRINAEARLGGGEVQPVDTDSLLQVLGEVRRLGYAYTSDLVTQGGASIAMPLPVTDGGQPLVIGMAGSSHAFQQHRDEYVAIMRQKTRAHFPPPPMPEIRRFHSGVATTVVSAGSRPWPMPTSPMPELMRA